MFSKPKQNTLIRYLIPSPTNIDLLNRNIAQNNFFAYNSEYFIKIFQIWLKSMNYDDEIITFRMCSRYDFIMNEQLYKNNDFSSMIEQYYDNIMIFETFGTPRFQNTKQYITIPFNPDLPDSATRTIPIETKMLQNYFYDSTLSTQNKQIKLLYNDYHDIIKKYIHKESPLSFKHPDFGILKLQVYCEPFHLYLNETNRRIIHAYDIDPGLHVFLDTGLKIYKPEFDLEWVTQYSTPILINGFQKHNYKLVSVQDMKIDINRSFFRRHYFGTTFNYNTVITDYDMQKQYIADHHLIIDHTGKSIKYYNRKIKHFKYLNGKITREETKTDITDGYEEWKQQQNIKQKIITCVNPYNTQYVKPKKIKFFNSKVGSKSSMKNITNTESSEEWTILSNNSEPITSEISCDLTEEDIRIK